MPNFTNLIAGPADLIALLVANYRCGHCNSETEAWTDQHGNLHLNIAHDDGCPVLDGTLSSLPDTLRATTTP
ncbi:MULTISPECIES: hypothetical protein [unclassified Streptomyces]|uniref:hypothetical protein n=1 Tax=unclassified Streptomyces TaxID=2593676 RepID=UPI0004CAC8F9|nr:MULTISPECIES: hypothetical protein [unclassified Streptomyces]KJY18384.1 hypothetical protein VR43_25175 [Streptomyces sp. NRRL S-104]